MILLLAPIVPSLAAELPTGFRSLRWGASIDEAEEMFPSATCFSSRGEGKGTDTGDGNCHFKTMIGKADVTVLLNFFEKPTTPHSARGFQSYAISYKSKDFPEIAEALSTRYGNPTNTNQEPFQTRSGLRDTNTILRWVLESCSIYAIKFSGSILEGGAVVSTKAGDAESERRRKAQKGESGKDL